MTHSITGKHLIGGDWISGTSTFRTSPASGDPLEISAGDAALVDKAVQAAEAAFDAYAATSREARAAFLDAIAEELEARVDDITPMAMAETALPEPRIRSVELPRTANQMRLFATHIRKGDYLDLRHDPAMPDRQPMPRPDLRMVQRPIGPVAVFGASNFPLAFSTAGGDTAAALAAGCPVVVKAHEAHAGTCELTASAIQAAAERTGMPTGVFNQVQGGSLEVGQALVQHPLIKAVGFTGSYKGGKALYDLCAQRDEPIPFFGEMGSINPMFLLPEAVSARAADLGEGWAASLTMGVGQFCTNPGIAVVLGGSEADTFRDAARAKLSETGPQTMLTDGIAAAYRGGAEALAGRPGVTEVVTSEPKDREATPFLFETDAKSFLEDETLRQEVFGPLGLIVRASSVEEMAEIARAMEGQLTVTLHMDDGDIETARKLVPLLERKAGRILANGFPTGVEVADAMVHGGPWPASSNFGATSVGTLAIRRFLRPVCYQNLPEMLVPETA
ncbi:2,5-dioxovalerate dehydrogenase [Roseivivax halodurans JCM 10272]|uniref:2,5-dioxovalerate dehydrogenase n=1 Tax=Roseivivax halodurans JCM 10272 TaxID=1449350 RepID=X7ED90_9RHOB|nr:aldehyde dehydrogenase (NADP(+)) [Roseivivax halodurans]ETX14049.1 2,5-dioxovalerate dehydrogenase [Roseivivax halodurans JCM 10272]